MGDVSIHAVSNYHMYARRLNLIKLPTCTLNSIHVMREYTYDKYDNNNNIWGIGSYNIGYLLPRHASRFYILIITQMVTCTVSHQFFNTLRRVSAKLLF